jgi:NADPH:quinone reductase-like Zn-dependent oxidoreductase|tara:strand:+ start:555 stop:773 length:219 start_codon:yes stop_codon:yes gene_type:complete
LIHTHNGVIARETKKELLTLKDMTEVGQLTLIVDRVYPMSDAAQAHGRVETEQRTGAIVLAITEQEQGDQST